MKTYYRNRLPHIVPLGGCFFITFCTYDSIPIHMAISRKEENFIGTFKKHDSIYDRRQPHFDLTQPDLAKIITNTIKKYDQNFYELLYYCIMPNHVHLVINTGFREDPVHLSKIMYWIKWGSSIEINKMLNRSGVFWQKDSYDHVIRSDRELAAIGAYILENPVKAGKVKYWEDWPYSFVKYT